MDNIQAQMNAILQNPEMMEQIMSMAQALGGGGQMPESPPEATGFSLPDIDPGMMQKIAGFIGQSKIDKNQQTLLTALAPYLSRERITKLEKAMRAAKLASLASTFLTSVGLGSNLSG